MRQLNRMPDNIEQTVIKKIRRVATNPFASNNNIKALRGNDVLRLRIDDRRVLYALDNESETITVINIPLRGHAHR